MLAGIGAERRRRQAFELVDEFMQIFPEVSNEIGVGIVEVVARGWYEVARKYAGPTLRNALDTWEPGWGDRQGPRRRAPDPYGVERALKLSSPPA